MCVFNLNYRKKERDVRLIELKNSLFERGMEYFERIKTKIIDVQKLFHGYNY